MKVGHGRGGQVFVGVNPELVTRGDSDRSQSRESALSGCRQGYFRCGRELLARAVRVSVPTALESLGRRVLI